MSRLMIAHHFVSCSRGRYGKLARADAAPSDDQSCRVQVLFVLEQTHDRARNWPRSSALPHFEESTMGKVNDENVRTGQQETNQPWKKPDHSDHHPDKASPSPRPRRAEDNKTS